MPSQDFTPKVEHGARGIATGGQLPDAPQEPCVALAGGPSHGQWED